ncbi:DUF3515 domain-containing protein [Arthrobacter sp. JCM 19049]|uniref:DUF3515 domain-containing protein n=1 Tax=Arthrobacter sp. JCM 19049 TaxID=1460643 RepID=UPI0027955FDF|nr:DUF3515 domain-containing protein [Arthrobacter sp. JCM 19049]
MQPFTLLTHYILAIRNDRYANKVAKMSFLRKPLSSRVSRFSKRAGLVAGSMTAVTLLTGCQAVLNVEAAPDAANPRCADMMVVLPEVMGDVEKRPTSSQATAAWGDPAQVVLRCGVQVPGPTPDPCVSVNGVDWIAREGDDGVWTLTTYGRSPATEILLDPQEIPSSTVTASLADAASKIPAERKCVSYDKALDNM